MKGGLVWSDVVASVTEDAVSGEILDSELAGDITLLDKVNSPNDSWDFDDPESASSSG